MKELSLNILDITENSVKAGATLTEINISETDEALVLTITDDGYGMKSEILETVTNPFTTTRTTRKVGMGIPLLKLAAEQTGGCVTIASKEKKEGADDHGTVITATFDTKSIDFTPVGDMVSTLCTLVQSGGDVDFEYSHTTPKGEVLLSTAEMRQMLGEDIPLSSFEVMEWLRGYLTEQYEVLKTN